MRQFHWTSAAMILTQIACVEGPGLFSKGEGKSTSYSVVKTSAEGITEGSFSAGSSATQTLEVADGKIGGSGVAFPPGSLAISTKISLQEGATLATGSLSSELGISSSVSPAGPAVVLSSALAIDASKDFKLKIPKSSSTKLLDESFLVVVYRVFVVAENTFKVGLIPTSQILISSDSVEISTRFFGSYQLAESPVEIEKPIVKASEIPILTKNEEKQLPKISMEIVSQPFLDDNLEVEVGIKLSAATKLMRCSAFVYEDSDEVWISSESTNSPDEIKVLSSGKVDTFTYNSESSEEQTVFFRFACVDDNGRDIVSKATEKITIPADDDGDTLGPVVEFVGWASYHGSSPLQRWITHGLTTTMQGSCDSSMPVQIYADSGAIPESLSVPCTNGQFAVGLMTSSCNSAPAGDAICLSSVTKGFKVYASQQFDAWDVTYVYVSYASPTILASAVDFYNALNSSPTGLHILSTDITLTSTWTMIPHFSAVLEGDGYIVSGLVLAETPMFQSITATGRVAHIGFDGPVLTATGATNKNNLGILAGTIESLAIDDISFYNPSMSITATGTNTNMGLLAGSSSYANIRGIRIYGDPSDYSAFGISVFNGENIGGIVGYVNESYLSDILVDAIRVQGKTRIGGIVGNALLTSNTNPFVASARVDVAIHSTQDASSNAYAGGIVGQDDPDCWSESVQVDVRFSSDSVSYYFGGIAGYFQGKATNADVTVSVDSTFNGTKFGGLAGFINDGSISSTIVRPLFLKNDSNSGALFGHMINGTIDRLDVVIAQDGSMPNWRNHPGGSDIDLATTTGNRIVYSSTITTYSCFIQQDTSNICQTMTYDAANFNTIFAGFDVMMPKWFVADRFEPYLFNIPDFD